MLQKWLIHQIMMKEVKNHHYLQEKNKKMVGLTKDERGSKIITIFATTAPETYDYRVKRACKG